MESHGTFPESAADASFRMIDVGEKCETRRRAVAQGRIRMAPETLLRVRDKTVPKGDVLALAEVAGIMAAKRTADILPLCHPLGLDAVRVTCTVDEAESSVLVLCEASTTAKTGVEMEALVGVNAALLSIYDLVKAIDPVLEIGQMFLRTKEGGKSGNWISPLLRETSSDVSNPGNSTGAAPSGYEHVRAAVVTVSDRCSRGEAEDRSGPELERALRALGAKVIERRLVSDDREAITGMVRNLARESQCELILLTGGTGTGPRDVTPEAMAPLWTRRVPGIGELLRSSGAKHTAMSWLSRSEGGFVDDTLVVLLPGSSKAVVEGMEVLRDLLPHALRISRGGDHAAGESARRGVTRRGVK